MGERSINSINRASGKIIPLVPRRPRINFSILKFLHRSQRNTGKVKPLIQARGTRNSHNSRNAIYEASARNETAYKRPEVLDVIRPSYRHIYVYFELLCPVTRLTPWSQISKRCAKRPGGISKQRQQKKLRRSRAPKSWEDAIRKMDP